MTVYEAWNQVMADRTEPRGDCLIWTGATSSNGYGVVDIHGVTRSTHRLAYESAHGAIPDGYHVDHLCKVRSCCNAAHLEAVPPRVNVVDRSDGITGVNARKDRCVNGHEFTPENTYHPPKRPGRRHCKTCAVLAQRRHRARKEAVA